MAHKIGVIEPLKSQPSTFIKKSAAQLLIRRLLAVWLIENVSIRLVEVKPAVMETRYIPGVPKHYIPEKMPPREVPGVYFKPPQSDTWRIQHRTAWQSWPQSGSL